ncbi:hypothetical protein EDD17DRAFT_1875928 [Pisolithus thermaeus]|nr:hypothetical protein EDD17DRAFT_1875928 [Pisolithus thermaeus]
MTRATVDKGDSSQMLGVNLPDRQSLPQAQIYSIDENISSVGVQVANVHPWIARDVEKFAEISIDAMLKAFLWDCDLGSSDKHVLFENCLEAVLPICNGSFRAVDLEVNMSDVQYHLHEYSKKYNENEDELYTDFVKAANPALRCLRQSHQGEVSERRPDIVLVSDQDFPGICGSESDNDITNSHRIFTTEKPRCPFGWRSVRTFVDCKTSKRKMKAPPRVYTHQPDAQPLEHTYFGAHVLDRTLAPPRSYALSAAPTSSATDSRPPTGELFIRSDRLQGKSSDSKRKRTLE